RDLVAFSQAAHPCRTHEVSKRWLRNSARSCSLLVIVINKQATVARGVSRPENTGVNLINTVPPDGDNGACSVEEVFVVLYFSNRVVGNNDEGVVRNSKVCAFPSS